MFPSENIRKATHWRHCIALVAFLFLCFFSRAQYALNDRCFSTYRQIILLRFQDARSLIKLEKSEHPGNTFPVYLENYIDFLTLFIGEEKDIYEKQKSFFHSRIKKLEQGDPNSPLFLFTQAEVNLQWALVGLKFEEYTSSALKIRKAYQLFSENQRIFPDFLPNRLGLGIIHIMAGLIPENYNWIARLAGVDGSVENGLSELQQMVSYKGDDRVFRMFRHQAGFYLSIATTSLSKDKSTALRTLLNMEDNLSADSLEGSPLFTFVRVNILMKNGKNDEARQVLESRTVDPHAFPFHYLDYLDGLTRLRKLDLTAGNCFQKYLTSFKGINYIKSAYQKLAWISWLKGDSTACRKYYERVKKFGNTIVDEDKQALYEAEKGIFPNKVLLKIRLLFDGGYYDQALNDLLGTPLKTYVISKKDFIEYGYRLARVYHERGNTDKALYYYLQTVELGKNETFYFAAAASFQMGLIYEDRREFKKADSVYRLCISMRNTEYKTSLNQKAKAGLNRLKKITY